MRRRMDAIVGLVLILAGAAVVLGTLWLKGSAFGGEEMVVDARFREIGQLVTGNAVKIRGVTVGQVASIELDPRSDAVLVGMRIERDVSLPADPVVVVSPRSMFGDWQVEIHPRGRFPHYEYHDGADPNVLPGYSLPDISQITAVADRIAENLAVITERVEVAFNEEAALNLQRAIENIGDVSEQLSVLVNSQQQTMDELADNFAETSRDMGEAAASVQRAFGRVDAALANGELDAIVANVEHASAQVDSLSAVLLQASGEFREVVTSADQAIRSFDEMTGRVNDGHGTLGRLLQDTLLYNEVIESNTALQELLRDIQANPRRYVQFRFFGR